MSSFCLFSLSVSVFSFSLMVMLLFAVFCVFGCRTFTCLLFCRFVHVCRVHRFVLFLFVGDMFAGCCKFVLQIAADRVCVFCRCLVELCSLLSHGLAVVFRICVDAYRLAF